MHQQMSLVVVVRGEALSTFWALIRRGSHMNWEYMIFQIPFTAYEWFATVFTLPSFGGATRATQLFSLTRLHMFWQWFIFRDHFVTVWAYFALKTKRKTAHEIWWFLHFRFTQIQYQLLKCNEVKQEVRIKCIYRVRRVEYNNKISGEYQAIIWIFFTWALSEPGEGLK